ncbi:hypothetical protein Golob_008869 [Gossypium lobatum]|uniref:Uncharacterized protein n=1 Tax=Gossypium lobatum TaxID=34289 RepID=A0A7J8MGS1_9ROSI|nr:hypothetical protein [Gossypium lobatum]
MQESSDHYRVTSETRGSGAGNLPSRTIQFNSPVEERDYNIRRVPAGCRMVLEESACDITMVTEDLRNIRGTFDKPSIGRLRKNREIHGGVVCFGHQNRGLHLEDFLQVVVN